MSVERLLDPCLEGQPGVIGGKPGACEVVTAFRTDALDDATLESVSRGLYDAYCEVVTAFRTDAVDDATLESVSRGLYDAYVGGLRNAR